MSPRPRLALVLAALALSALYLPWQGVVVAALAALVVAAVDAWLARAVPAVERTAQTLLARGVPAPLVVDAGPGLRTIVKQPRTAELAVDPRVAVGRLETTVVGRRRGRHELPTVAVRVDGPLGLASWYRAAGDPAELVVYPDLPAARRLARAAREGRFRDEGRRRGPLGLGTEFETVRDYQPDDDIRQVNWLASQRVGRPMSNQYRVEREREVICVVDCGRLTAAPVGDRTRLDAFLDAAVAVAATADELGDRAGVIAFDAELRRVLAPRRRGARAVVSATFDLEPRPVDSDYERAFAAVGRSKRAFVLILTDVVDETAAGPLLSALPLLARRHAVAVAAIEDGDLAAVLELDPRVEADVFRQAAAADALSAREHVLARVRTAGADVVEAPLASFSGACVRSYVRAKTRARL